MATRAVTQISSRTETSWNEGEITGVKIRQLRAAGDITIQSNNYLTRPDVSLDPPPAAAIRAYLTAAAQKQSPPEDAKDKEQAIWEIQFRAHKAGDQPPHDLYHIFQKISSENQQHGGFQRVVLLADAGMGKTPALLYLREETARASLGLAEDISDKGPANRKDCIIPLYIHLEHLDGGHPLMDLVRDSFNSLIAKAEGVNRITINETQGLLQKYSCLLLFDDLGELLSHPKMGGFQVLSHFMEVYREHEFLISCCTSWYREQLGSLDILYLDNLTQEEAERIVGEQTYRKLEPTAQELARNRGFLVQYIRLGEPSDLLRTKGRLLQMQVSEILATYSKEYEKKNLEVLCDVQILVGLLEDLAFHMRIDHTHAYTDQQLMDVMSAFLQNWKETVHWRKLAHELHSSKLKFLTYDPKRRNWRFCSISTEAYFASSAILHHPQLLEVVLGEIDDYWWRDVFEVLVGLYPEPRTLMLELIDRNVFVAANCLRFVGEVGVEDALIDALDERMKLESSARRKYIVERIGESNLECAAESLVKCIHREWSSMVVMAAVKALLSWQKRTGGSIERAESTVLHALCDTPQSITSLLRLFPGEGRPGNAERLLSIFKDPNSPQKNRGLVAIGLGLINTREVRNTLYEMLVDEKADDFVAWCSVEALTQTQDPEICKQALRLVTGKGHKSDPFSHARARAVYLLGWTGRGARAANLLRKALRDQNYLVRGYAIDAMARLDLLDAREQIEEILSDPEEQSFVHRKAAEALGQIGTLESIQVLERCLFKQQARTRWAIRRAIEEINQRNSLSAAY
jgi:hypothetical protein